LTGKTGTGIRDAEGSTEVEEWDWNILLNEACIYPKINLTRQFLFAKKSNVGNSVNEANIKALLFWTGRRNV
jgi:hypothetical protein